MTTRHTYRVHPFTPANAPKYLAVWHEDYPFTIEPASGKQGFTFEGNSITVYYSESSPIGLFHLLMTQVVVYISHRLGLEAIYLAPSEERQYKPQPYTLGWQEMSDQPSMVNIPETPEEDDYDDDPTVIFEAPYQMGLETPAEERPFKPEPWTYGE
jgi:hypothetical protein